MGILHEYRAIAELREGKGFVKLPYRRSQRSSDRVLRTTAAATKAYTK